MSAFLRVTTVRLSLHSSRTVTKLEKPETIGHPRVPCLQSQPQACACVYHPGAGFTSPHHHIWLTHCDCCGEMQASMLARQLLYWLSPLPRPCHKVIRVLSIPLPCLFQMLPAKSCSLPSCLPLLNNTHVLFCFFFFCTSPCQVIYYQN